MSQDSSSPPEQITFGEAVKLVKSKPSRGRERTDLIVRDEVLEPYWHWCRMIGVPREEAVEQSTKVFLEEVILVGKAEKVKGKKKENGGASVRTTPAPASTPIPASVVTTPDATKTEEPRPNPPPSRPGIMTWMLAGVEGFLIAITVYFSFVFGFPMLDTLVIIATGAGAIGATIAGGWALRRRAARRDSDLPVMDAKPRV